MRRYLFFVFFIFCVIFSKCNEQFGNLSSFVSISEFVPNSQPQNGRWCYCWNNTDTEYDYAEFECHCYGSLLVKLPKRLPKIMQKLTVNNAGIKIITKNSLQSYKNYLTDVTLSNLPQLEIIEPGTFRNMDHLRSLYISHAPMLKKLPMLFVGATSKKFLSLRIVHTGLEDIPDLSYLDQNKILHMVELENNEFHSLPKHSIKIKAEQVILNYNKICCVDAFAFEGSEIGKLSLEGNKKLKLLHEDAFAGLTSLIELDLSGTSIENLPVKGLDNMEVLKIQDTKSLKAIPSVYNFKSLQEAWLTHSFHCCAFKYPAQHDPIEHAKLERFCHLLTSNNIEHEVRSRRHIDNRKNEEWFNEKTLGKGNDEVWGLQFDEPFLNHTKFFDAIRGNSIGSVEESDNLDFDQEIIGTFHQTSVPIQGGSGIEALCGNISQRTRDILCYPKPDALNPCEDIMGSYWLRISVWFVVVMAVVGNLAVIMVFFSSLFDINVQKFLMCHLACADICMGLYLFLIAAVDLHSMGYYFNFAFDWQIGAGCRIAGFLTVFASQLSVFTLTIITLERWFAIRHAIHLNRRIRLGTSVKIMAGGWIYSLLMASLPLFGISNYSSTSICLPMEAQDMQDKTYLVVLLITNGLAFLAIVVCYTQIYFSLGRDTRRCSSNSEMTIAKKMALLVFTDFACWAPIAFFGLTALAGYPLIDVTRSKILLVFFYPLNSCANPYLYAILTAQYRRDLFSLLYKIGLCKKTIQKYTRNTSSTIFNQANAVPLLNRSNGRKISEQPNNYIGQAPV